MTTPFYPPGVPYAGMDPGVVQPWFAGDIAFWLGRPGNLIELPRVNSYQATLGQGEVEQGLAGGVSGVTRLGSMTRRYQLGFTFFTGRDWQIVQGFYLRAFGNGPWCFLPPEDVNRLTRLVSLCGAVNGVAEGWTASVGTLGFAADGALAPGGRLTWTGAGVGSLLQPARSDSLLLGVPYVPALPYTASVYARTASGSPSARLLIRGIASDGTSIVTTITGTAVTLSTTPQRLTLGVGPGGLGASVFVQLVVECRTASAPVLSVSCPQLELAAAASDWQVGSGVPRVIWPAVLGDVPVSPHMTRDFTMMLAEAVPGAA